MNPITFLGQKTRPSCCLAAKTKCNIHWSLEQKFENQTQNLEMNYNSKEFNNRFGIL